MNTRPANADQTTGSRTHWGISTTAWRWIVGFAVAAGLLLGLRWGLCFREPRFRFGDEELYWEIAHNLVVHHAYRLDRELLPVEQRAPRGWGDFASRDAPGLPFSLALMGQVTPLTPLTAQLLNATAGWFTILLYSLAAFWLTRNRLVALTVMLAVGLHPPFLFLNTTNYPQTFQACWLAVLVAVIVYVRRTDPESCLAPRWGLAEGGVLGISALYVPTQLFLLPALALAQFGRPWRRWVVYSLSLGIGFGLALLPWIIRNAIAERAFIPFSTQGGEQMYIGFNERAGPNVYPTDAQSGSGRVGPAQSSAVEKWALSAKTGREREEIYRTAAVEWIRAHLGTAAQLWAAKAINYFRWDFGLMHTKEEGAVYWRMWLSRLTTLFVYLVFLLGSMLCLGSERFWVRWTCLSLLFLACGHAFFSSRYRYRLPLEPLLLFVGLTRLGAGLQQRPHRWLAAWAERLFAKRRLSTPGACQRAATDRAAGS